MASIWNGQDRRAWLDRQDQKLTKGLAYYLGPAAKPISALAQGMAMFSPGADMIDARQSGQELMQAKDWRGAATAGGGLAAAMAGMAIPGTAKGVTEAAETGIRAFHGSPHDFDKFDLSKIGTGEGAQAYGHGLYFAESEGVAKSYRDALNPDYRAALSYAGPDRAKNAASMLAADIADADVLDGLKALDDPNPEASLAAGRRLLEEAKGKGKMYEVRINANPDDFLDWDKPLSEQPKVLQRLRAEGAKYRDEVSTLTAERDAILAQQPPPHPPTGDEFADLFAGSDWDGWQKVADLNSRIEQARRSGEDAAKRGALYSDDLNEAYLSSTFGRGLARGKTSSDAIDLLGLSDDRQLSNTLREAGIPGIRYLDQGSRSAGDGSRNYVAFDDKIIDILRKYGIAGLMMGGGGMLAAQGQQEQ